MATRREFLRLTALGLGGVTIARRVLSGGGGFGVMGGGGP